MAAQASQQPLERGTPPLARQPHGRTLLGAAPAAIHGGDACRELLLLVLLVLLLPPRQRRSGSRPRGSSLRAGSGWAGSSRRAGDHHGCRLLLLLLLPGSGGPRTASAPAATGGEMLRRWDRLRTLALDDIVVVTDAIVVYPFRVLHLLEHSQLLLSRRRAALAWAPSAQPLGSELRARPNALSRAGGQLTVRRALLRFHTRHLRLELRRIEAEVQRVLQSARQLRVRVGGGGEIDGESINALAEHDAGGLHLLAAEKPLRADHLGVLLRAQPEDPAANAAEPTRGLV